MPAKKKAKKGSEAPAPAPAAERHDTPADDSEADDGEEAIATAPTLVQQIMNDKTAFPAVMFACVLVAALVFKKFAGGGNKGPACRTPPSHTRTHAHARACTRVRTHTYTHLVLMCIVCVCVVVGGG